MFSQLNGLKLSELVIVNKVDLTLATFECMKLKTCVVYMGYFFFFGLKSPLFVCSSPLLFVSHFPCVFCALHLLPYMCHTQSRVKQAHSQRRRGEAGEVKIMLLEMVTARKESHFKRDPKLCFVLVFLSSNSYYVVSF